MEERRTYIGGGDIAAIMGKSPFANPYDVYLHKVEGKCADVSEAMEWGTALEPLVVSKYEDRTHCWVDAQPGLVRHPDLPYIGGHPDGIGNRDGEEFLVEVKTTSAWMRPAWNDGVPEHVQLQCQLYMLLTGTDRAEIPVLFGGQEMVVFHLDACEQTQREIVVAATTFWNLHVEGKQPPDTGNADVDASPLFPNAEGVAVANDHDLDLLRELRSIRDSVSGPKKRQDEISKAMSARMHRTGCTHLVTSDGKTLAEIRTVHVKERHVPASTHERLSIKPNTALAKLLDKAGHNNGGE